MSRIWNVRCIKNISPNTGLVVGYSISVTTQQNNKDWYALRLALKDEGKEAGGCLNDAYWEWN